MTKNHLVTRDTDLLSMLAEHNAAGVSLSITTLDPKLAQILEPRASTPKHRLQAIADLSSAGVPVGVNVAPIIPGLNEHEIPAILEAAAAADAQFAFYTIVRLPLTVAPIFVNWLEKHFPNRKENLLEAAKKYTGTVYGLRDDSAFVVNGTAQRVIGSVPVKITDGKILDR